MAIDLNNYFEQIIKGWLVFTDTFREILRDLERDTRPLWACKIILEISFLMIWYLTKLYVVIQIPSRNVKKAVLHNLCETFDGIINIIFLAYTLEYSKVKKKLERKETQKS